MSRSRKDQRGGHRRRRSDTYSCGCCDILVPNHESRNRTRRERVSLRYEASAHNAGRTHQKASPR
jgi:hypothetical protein